MSTLTPEVRHALIDARYELVSLRRQVAALQPRAASWDVLAQVVSMIPQPPQGAAIDTVWTIDQLLGADADEAPKAGDDA